MELRPSSLNSKLLINPFLTAFLDQFLSFREHAIHFLSNLKITDKLAFISLKLSNCKHSVLKNILMYTMSTVFVN